MEDALTLRAERQSAWTSKITNDGLTRLVQDALSAPYGNTGRQRVEWF